MRCRRNQTVRNPSLRASRSGEETRFRRKKLKVAIAGFGTVGRSVAKLLCQEANETFELTHIFNRNVAGKKWTGCRRACAGRKASAKFFPRTSIFLWSWPEASSPRAIGFARRCAAANPWSRRTSSDRRKRPGIVRIWRARQASASNTARRLREEFRRSSGSRRVWPETGFTKLRACSTAPAILF